MTLLATLVEWGFSKERAYRALQATGSEGGIEAAIAWLEGKEDDAALDAPVPGFTVSAPAPAAAPAAAAAAAAPAAAAAAAPAAAAPAAATGAATAAPADAAAADAAAIEAAQAELDAEAAAAGAAPPRKMTVEEAKAFIAKRREVRGGRRRGRGCTAGHWDRTRAPAAARLHRERHPLVAAACRACRACAAYLQEKAAAEKARERELEIKRREDGKKSQEMAEQIVEIQRKREADKIKADKASARRAGRRGGGAGGSARRTRTTACRLLTGWCRHCARDGGVVGGAVVVAACRRRRSGSGNGCRWSCCATRSSATRRRRAPSHTSSWCVQVACTRRREARREAGEGGRWSLVCCACVRCAALHPTPTAHAATVVAPPLPPLRALPCPALCSCRSNWRCWRA